MPVLSPPENTADSGLPDSPLHGFRGERQAEQDRLVLPLALTVAVSRETGSRGIVIARQTAKKLGWAFYDQERLEYLAEQEHLQGELVGALDEAQRQWIETRLKGLDLIDARSEQDSVRRLARVVLALGVRGETVILGRGAGCILPSESTLYVRVVAPVTDRIAFLTQLERLTPAQAKEQVAARDKRRAEFVAHHFRRMAADVCQFDLLLNSSKLGEDASIQVVVAAARLKAAAWTTRRSAATERLLGTE